MLGDEPTTPRQADPLRHGRQIENATEQNGFEINLVGSRPFRHPAGATPQVFQLDPRITDIAEALSRVFPQAPGKQDPNGLREWVGQGAPVRFILEYACNVCRKPSRRKTRVPR